MAEIAGLKFELTSGKSIPGGPICHCYGTLESNGTIAVTKVEITQALPPPHGTTPVTNPKGRWAEEVMGQQEDLILSFTGEVTPEQGSTVVVPFSSRFQFPHKGLLKPGETLHGQGSFTFHGKPLGDEPAELRLR